MINKSLESPSEKHPLSLNVYGLRTCIYLLLTCWTPHVSLTFMLTMDPSVCQIAL